MNGIPTLFLFITGRIKYMYNYLHFNYVKGDLQKYNKFQLLSYVLQQLNLS